MSEKKRFERLFLYALFGYMIRCAPAPATSPPPTTPHFTSSAPPFDPPRARHSRPVERPLDFERRVHALSLHPSGHVDLPPGHPVLRASLHLPLRHPRVLPSPRVSGVSGRRDRAGARQLHLQHRPPHGKDLSKDVPPRVKHFAETLYAVCMPLSNFVGATMFGGFSSQSSRARRGSTAWAPPGSPSSREENTHLSRSVPYFREHAASRGARKSNADAAETLKKVKKKI